MKKFKRYITKIIFPAAALILMAVKIENPGGIFPSYGDNTFLTVISRLIVIALSLASLVAMAFLIYGGFQYITSRGNEEQTESSKRTLFNAIIGLIVIILSYVIVVVISNTLNKL